MKREKICEIIENIDDKYIEEAAEYSGETKFKKQHTFSKLKALAACIAIIFAATGGYFIFRTAVPPKNIIYESDYFAADRAFDLSDTPRYVGATKYVFVAKVNETHDYYTERLFHDFPAVIDYFDSEFTECRLTVVSNIKGDLAVSKDFSYYKSAGVNKLRTRIVLYDRDDTLPEVGKYYVFFGTVHPDGTMTGGGTYPLENGINESNLETSAVYQKYVDAYNNQIITHRKFDYMCSADINYDDGSYNAEIYAEYLKWNEGIEKKYAAEQSMNYEEFHKKHFDYKYDNAVKKGNPKIQ